MGEYEVAGNLMADASRSDRSLKILSVDADTEHAPTYTSDRSAQCVREIHDTKRGLEDVEAVDTTQ